MPLAKFKDNMESCVLTLFKYGKIDLRTAMRLYDGVNNEDEATYLEITKILESYILKESTGGNNERT